ncbi:MAG: hypothetical protein L0H53_04250 [Candidatus Nitrosocosmicus sp.]|nr:hypothetical protein [Candidatus Nitrosocosmicus sp.]MDN5868304.1 hypothetical protein [Candidatus Nitrosocosmicus sp.]
MSGYVEMKVEDARYREFDHRNVKYLSVIQKNTKRLQSMIEKIMDVAKIEKNSFVPNRVSIEIN